MTIITEVAKKCVERMNYLGTKGKRRDDACINYIAGAAQMSAFRDGAETKLETNCLCTWLALVVSVHGFKAVQRAANGEG